MKTRPRVGRLSVRVRPNKLASRKATGTDTTHQVPSPTNVQSSQPGISASSPCSHVRPEGSSAARSGRGTPSAPWPPTRRPEPRAACSWPMKARTTRQTSMRIFRTRSRCASGRARCNTSRAHPAAEEDVHVMRRRRAGSRPGGRTHAARRPTRTARHPEGLHPARSPAVSTSMALRGGCES